MQLVSNDSRQDDVSESEPILTQTNILLHSEEESSASREIKSLGRDSDVHVAELESIHIDETCHLVNPNQPQCRICLDIGGEDLIAPCHCKGTQKYVHRSCLDNWRSTKEGFAFAHCTECRAMFILRANVPADRWWLRLKFHFLVARDHALIFIVVQLVVAFLGVLVYKFYGEELREMFGYEEHRYGFYTMADPQPFIYDLVQLCKAHGSNRTREVLAIVLVGLLYGFFIAIICGQRINERHYHVLAKQELTKEYVVEDREACKNVPELGASHVSELRMLGLC